jgi:precorrin-6Y C5,15-methyltransferase (decarboxylating)
VVGRAPEALNGLPRPDAVFIGGGAAEPGVFEACWAALRGRTSRGQRRDARDGAAAAELFAGHGGAMRRIALSRLEPVGGMHGWRAAMPVTQWIVQKP